MSPLIRIFLIAFLLTLVINKTATLRSRWVTLGYVVFFLLTFFAKAFFPAPVYTWLWFLFLVGLPIYILNRLTGPWGPNKVYRPAAMLTCLFWILGLPPVKDRLFGRTASAEAERRKDAVIDSLYQLHRKADNPDSIINAYLVEHGFERE